MKMSINEFVWVKLTLRGKHVWKNHWQSVLHGKFVLPEPNRSGHHKFQMRALMLIFGPEMYCDASTLFEGNEILFSEPM